ncbi:DUF3572 domain-containing protein [Litorisediminicola beolgyonensis]|uniref:DUF3572 domain-containing protein n=1 Tax=Litorisediminicola beolgyonensis TaxID=1173614 RepID=A0ABW3ZKG7_9RHOB
MATDRERAEIVGLQAVAWLAGHDDLLPVFLGSTGADAETFRTALADPVFQGSVLDFLMMDDAWLTEFCDARELPYDAPMRARMALPGGEQVNWT